MTAVSGVISGYSRVFRSSEGWVSGHQSARLGGFSKTYKAKLECSRPNGAQREKVWNLYMAISDMFCLNTDSALDCVTEA